MENEEKPKLDDFTANLVRMAAGKADAAVTENADGTVVLTGEHSKSLDEGTRRGLFSMLGGGAAVVSAKPVKSTEAPAVKEALPPGEIPQEPASAGRQGHLDYAARRGNVDDENSGRVGKWLKQGYQIVGQTPALRRGEIKDLKELEKWKQHFARGTRFTFSGGTLYALRKLNESVDEALSHGGEVQALMKLGRGVLLDTACDLAGSDDDAFRSYSIRDLAVYCYEAGYTAVDGKLVRASQFSEMTVQRDDPGDPDTRIITVSPEGHGAEMPRHHKPLDVRLRRKSETNEWIAAVYINGRFSDAASYYAGDKEDAIQTIKHMRKRYGLDESVVGSAHRVAYVNALAGYFEYSPTSETDAKRRAIELRKAREAFVTALIAKGATKTGAEEAADAIRREYFDSIDESKLSESVQEWLASKINAALIALGVSPEQHQSIEDTVYAAALAGKLGDGTPSDATAAQVQSMVAELAAVNAAPTPKPDEVEAPEIPAAPLGADDAQGDVAVTVTRPQPGEEPDLDTEQGIDAELDKMSALDVEPDVKPEHIDPEALEKGIAVEMEHTTDEEVAAKIARQHIGEDPDYYDKLEKMEKGGKKTKTEAIDLAKPDITPREQRHALFDIEAQDTTMVAVQKQGEIIAQRMTVRQARHMLFDIHEQDEPSPYVIRVIAAKTEAKQATMVCKDDDGKLVTVSIDDEARQYNEVAKENLWKTIDADNKYFSLLSGDGYVGRATLTKAVYDAVKARRKSKKTEAVMTEAEKVAETQESWKIAKVVIESYTQKSVLSLEIWESRSESYACKAMLKGKALPFFCLFRDNAIQEENLEEVEFKTWPPRDFRESVFTPGRQVMVEHLGELCEGRVIDANQKQAQVSLDEGILVIIDLRNITPLDTEDEYINRVDAGEPVESILEDMADRMVAGGQVC